MLADFLSTIMKTVTDKQIGIQLKKARMEKNLSQEELGERLGVTWEMISRYENGRSSARKYLSQLSEILEKPISYFFGVESSIVEYNVEKIAEALREKGIGYSGGSSSKVILVDDLTILGFEKSLKLTRQFYSVPEWISEKYKDLFALRLDTIIAESFDKNPGDIGFFTTSHTPQTNDMVLIQSGRHYKVQRYSKKLTSPVLATLIVQEKRYL